MIPSSYFVKEMKKHWTKRLGNVPNEGLKEAWKLLADSFTALTSAYSDPIKEKVFTALPLPTGSGKTQGTILYFSMLNRLPAERVPGGLIVTKRIKDANDIAAEINRLSRGYNSSLTEDVAISYTSEVKDSVSLEELAFYPVLVITHRAYELALEKLGNDGTIPKTWEAFYGFGETGRRKLVVIDEAIDLIEHFKADINDLKALPFFFTENIREEFPKEIQVVDALTKRLKEMKPTKQKEAILSDVFRELATEFNREKLNFSSFRETIRKTVEFEKLMPFAHKTDTQERQRIRKSVDESIKAVDALLKTWIYYSKDNSVHTLNTAWLLIPDDDTIKGAIILDATAKSNTLYELFEGIQVIASPPRVRTYGNVTRRVSKGHRTGKRYLTKNGKEQARELMANLKAELQGKPRSVLIVTHATTEPHLKDFTAEDLGIKRLAVNHYGNIDGSNEWKDFDTVVLFGLPFKPQTWAANSFMAFQGVQTTEWLHRRGNRPFKKHQDIRKAIETGQLVTDIVQAINRIRCRRVIDTEGNCPPADIFLMIPDNRDGEEILKGIEREMPGIRSKEWTLKAAVKSVRKGKHEETLKSFFLNAMSEGDRLSTSSIRKDLGIPPKTLERYLDRMKQGEEKDPLVKALRDAKVSVEFHGKGKPTYFKKAA